MSSQVRLSNEGAAFHIDDSDAEKVVPINTVIQAPFHLTHKVEYAKLYSGHSDEPLLRITVTRFQRTGETSIGFSTSHAVGGPSCLFRQFNNIILTLYTVR
jgi:hypothetical protein